MSQGFVNAQNIPLPVPVTLGGTGQTLSTGTGAVVLESANKVVLLGTATAASSASIQFLGINGALYSELFVVYESVLSNTTTGKFACQIATGASFLGTGYFYYGFRWDNTVTAVEGLTSTGAWLITSTVATMGATVNSNEISGIIRFPGCATTKPLKTYVADTTYFANGGGGLTITYRGELLTNAAPISDIRFITTAGLIASGKFYLYGVKNS